MQKNSTLIHDLTHEQLVSLFGGLQNQLTELKQNFQTKEPAEYLTRKEVAELLKVDLSTLFNWHKKSKLVPFGIGHRVLYRRSDIESALILLGEKKGAENP